jgi:hypothetical protein
MFCVQIFKQTNCKGKSAAAFDGAGLCFKRMDKHTKADKESLSCLVGFSFG